MRCSFPLRTRFAHSFLSCSLKEPTLVVQTVVEGLQAYFDKALGTQLLYRFERVQYADMRRRFWTGQEVIVGQTDKEVSFIYGAEHLLRMLGEFELDAFVLAVQLTFRSSFQLACPR